MINSFVIMAAGKGKRMLSLTEKVPKALLIFKGKPLISYSLDKLAEIENKYVTVGHLKNQLIYYLEGKISSTIDTTNKGNSWWVYNSIVKDLDEPVFASTCDGIYDINLSQVYGEYLKNGSPACMIIPANTVKEVEGDYIKTDKTGKIIGLSREKISDIYCSGLQIINPSKINRITDSCDNFKELWNQLIEKSELYCSKVFPTNWFSIDTPENLKRFENFSN